MRTSRTALVALALCLSLTACSKGGADSNGPPDPGSPAGGNGFEGGLATSGLYAANWTASPDAQVDPFNSVSSVTLTSDQQTFGFVGVQPDGTITFGSGASELSHNAIFNGSGAHVTLDESGAFVCAFTVDTDLTGSTDGAILHMAGGMTVHWHPEGLGDISCP